MNSDRAIATNSQSTSSGVLLIFILILTSIQGLTLNLMPVMFRTFGRTFGLSLGEEGQIQSFFFLGAMIALFSSGWITERLGLKRSSSLVLALIGTGAMVLGISHDYTIAKVGATLMGVGNQWVLAISSAVIAARFQHVRQKMFMWVMGVMAAAASAGPVSLGYLLIRVPNWHTIFLTIGLTFWIGSIFLHRLLETQLHSVPPSKASDKMSAPELLRSPILWVAGFLVVLDNLASGNLIAWTPRLFQVRYDVNETLAGLVLTANTVGMLAGRILLGTFVSGRVSDRLLLSICYAAGMVMYSLLLVAPTYPVAVVLMGLQGVFLSAQAPSVYSLTVSKFPARAAVAVPMVDAIGSLGGIAGPALLGWSAEKLGGLGGVLWSVPCLGFLLALISLCWEYYDRGKTGRLQQS